MTYWGLMRSMALPLEFVLDGRQILRTAWYTDGVEAEVLIEVEQLDRRTYKYRPIFKGDLDFSEAEDLKDYFSIPLMEGGATKRIKAYESTKYEYALTGTGTVEMILPGVAFTEQSTNIFNGEFTPDRSRFIPSSSVIQPFVAGIVEVQSTLYQNVGDASFSSSDNWFARNIGVNAQQINISGRIKGLSISFFGNSRLSIRIVNQSNVTIQTIYNNQTSANPILIEFNFEFNHFLSPGEKLFYYVRAEDTGARIAIGEGEFNINYGSKSDPTPCRGITGLELFKRIVSKVSPGTSAVSSLLGSDEWKNLIFTSGNAIRQFENPKIQITYKEFFDTINGLLDAGLGILNNEVRIEKADFFMRYAQVFDLSKKNVKSCKFTPATELMFSNIKIGYNDGNTDEKNGLEEYNSQQTWAMPLTRIEKEKNWVSPTRADQYGIEKLRISVVKREATADTSSDNNTFMVDCYIDGSVYRPILGSTYDSITGLTSPLTAYNLRLTPKKNLLRHGGFLRSLMDRIESRYIAFGSATKNAELSTVKLTEIVKENQDILGSSLSNAYFKPVIATIVTDTYIDTMTLLDQAPFGFIVFKYFNVILRGFIMEVSVDIAKNTEREFKLLLTTDSDLTRLL